MISLSDALNSSCSVVMVVSPVSFRSRSARIRSRAGAYVSGMVTVKAQTTAANIIFTQMIQRQPTVSPTNPPTMGPRTGPP